MVALAYGAHERYVAIGREREFLRADGVGCEGEDEAGDQNGAGNEPDVAAALESCCIVLYLSHRKRIAWRE